MRFESVAINGELVVICRWISGVPQSADSNAAASRFSTDKADDFEMDEDFGDNNNESDDENTDDEYEEDDMNDVMLADL